MLSIGTKLPDFSLLDSNGETVTNASWKGSWVVLYFYPKDSTPGCTEQACSIRDSYGPLQATGAKIYGISANTAKQHAKFIAEHDLPFPLLIDEGHKFSETMDVWVEKSMYGKKYMAIERSTYIINPDGIIAGAYQKVATAGHGEFVLTELKKLQ